jgi:hypothetical protein
MVPGCLVSATETFAVVSPGAFGNMRMTILVTIVDVWSAMVVVVFTGPLDSVVVSPLLNLAEFLWRLVPVTVMIAVMVLKCGSRRCEGLGHGDSGR